jgi:hypothetical protein
VKYFQVKNLNFLDGVLKFSRGYLVARLLDFQVGWGGGRLDPFVLSTYYLNPYGQSKQSSHPSCDGLKIP